jgi:hypothetical protein
MILRSKNFIFHYLLSLFLPSVLICFFCVSNPLAKEKPRIVVLPFQVGQGISVPEALYLTDIVRSGLIETGKYHVISNDQMEAQLKIIQKKQQIGSGSCTSEKCIIDLGNALECEKMIVGYTSGAFNEFIISVTMFDVVKQNYLMAKSVRIKNKNEFPDAAGKIVELISGFKVKNSFPATKSIHMEKYLKPSRYADNGDGTITDSANNLVWKKCSQGQIYDAACIGQAVKFQYCTAEDSSCDNGTVLTSGPAFESCNFLNSYPKGGFAGRTNWKLPTKAELKSLVFCSNGAPTPLDNVKRCGWFFSSPTINKTMFPNTVTGGYWSISVNSSDGAWGVHFASGKTGINAKTRSYYVRCVSTGP